MCMRVCVLEKHKGKRNRISSSEYEIEDKKALKDAFRAV